MEMLRHTAAEICRQARTVGNDGNKHASRFDVGDDLLQVRIEHRLAAGDVDTTAFDAVCSKVIVRGIDHALGILQRQILLVELCKAVATVVVAFVGDVEVNNVRFHLFIPFLGF